MSDERTTYLVQEILRRRCYKGEWSLQAAGPSQIMIFVECEPTPRGSIAALDHDFPGRRMQVRIDDNGAIRLGTGPTPSARATAEMLRGAEVKIEYYEWPYDYPKYSVASLRPTERDLEWTRLHGNGAARPDMTFDSFAAAFDAAVAVHCGNRR